MPFRFGSRVFFSPPSVEMGRGTRFSKGHTVPFPTVDNVTDGKSGNKKAVLKDWGEWFYKGNALVLKCTQGRWALSSEYVQPPRDPLHLDRLGTENQSVIVQGTYSTDRQ